MPTTEPGLYFTPRMNVWPGVAPLTAMCTFPPPRVIVTWVVTVAVLQSVPLNRSTPLLWTPKNGTSESVFVCATSMVKEPPAPSMAGAVMCV